MPSAGAVCPPVITPIRKHIYGQTTNHIDTSTLIEIICETPNTKIYFTADGTKPNPFQRKIGGREVTHRYTDPFTLKEGKRTIKAVAVTRDGVKESDVFTKAFVVDDIGKINSTPIDVQTSSCSDLDTTDFFDDSDGLDYTDSTLKSYKSNKSTKLKTKKKNKPAPPTTLRSRSRSKSPTRRPTVPKDAWASSGVTERLSTGAFGENPPAIPDGPFNPTNYSGTQINVWGGAPPPLMQGVPGVVSLGQPGLCNPYTTQYGYLTENMVQNCNPDTRHVTVGDLRTMMRKPQEKPAIAAPPPPEPERIEVPVYKDPPLNPISPGGGRHITWGRKPIPVSYLSTKPFSTSYNVYYN